MPERWRVNGIVPFGNLIDIGFISVGFFFTLSGYILSVVYLQPRRDLNPRKFWIARFARIYPLFAASLLLDVPNVFLYRLGKYGLKMALAKTSVTLAGNLLMLQVWFLKLRFLNAPVWSLGVESFFYFLFPFLGWRLWKASARGAIWGSILLYAAGMALVGLGRYIGLTDGMIEFTPVFHLHELFIGVLLAKWHSHALESQKRQEILTRIAPWIALASLCLFIFAVYNFHRVPELFFRCGLLLPVYVLAIVAFATGNRWLEAVFAIPALVVLGEASYALYLIHVPIAHYFALSGLKKAWSYPVYLGLCLGLSLASFYLFENPARQAILRWAHSRSKETTMVASIAQ